MKVTGLQLNGMLVHDVRRGSRSGLLLKLTGEITRLVNGPKSTAASRVGIPVSRSPNESYSK